MQKATTTEKVKPAAAKAAKPGSKAVQKAAKRNDLQETFLDELIRNQTRVSIFLVNGVKLEGEIKSYDRFVILMKNAVSDKVYKHAISTVMPLQAKASAVEVVIEKKRASRVPLRRPQVP